LTISTELDSRARSRLGTTLRGKYRLDRVLGIGGMAVVYGATHRNQKQVAIKMLHAELSLREDVRQRFLREGYAANSVKHPGALAVLDDDSAEDGSAFLVMELLEGASLDDLWERWDHRFPLEQVLAIGERLLDVLAAAHEKGIVHRDIKPANLFVTREGSLKVLDFGIARVRDAAASSANATGTGMLLGTPAFMSPEQAFAKASEIDEQTDLWAVGATLFTLASGRTVHEGETASEIVIHTATKPARSLGTVAPDLPPGAVSVIGRALAFAKSDRWASAAAMRSATANPAPRPRPQDSPRASATSAPVPSSFTPTVSVDDLPASGPALRLPGAPRDVAGAASAAATATAPLRASSPGLRPGAPHAVASALPRTGPAPDPSATARRPGPTIDDGF